MATVADTKWIEGRAKALGFDLCGVVAAQKFPELEHYQGWLDRGYGGEMKYLEDPRRQNPSGVMQGARSVIVCGLNYNTRHPYSTEGVSAPKISGTPKGWISRYAWGDDYHEVMWKKLNALAGALPERFAGQLESRAYADTGPIAERIAAKYAGLGWLGKNTLLLNEELGSWLFLGVILSSLELTPSLAGELPSSDLCGNCRQCLDACPTGALGEPYILDARRCISYLTIELRGPIPEEFREAMGWQVYGCDICQDVCPFNRNPPTSGTVEFQPRGLGTTKSLLEPSLRWLANLDEPGFRELFRGSAMKRAKWKGLVRNACIALGNAEFDGESGDRRKILRRLEELCGHEDAGIAVSAEWAVSRIQRKRT